MHPACALRLIAFEKLYSTGCKAISMIPTVWIYLQVAELSA
ncbi:UNVERIFIED_CONTAM: hypothetical protein GTU68_027326 [Idotea baltica]|nr:hypothetical protein [Idotea baltica]